MFDFALTPSQAPVMMCLWVRGVMGRAEREGDRVLVPRVRERLESAFMYT